MKRMVVALAGLFLSVVLSACGGSSPGATFKAHIVNEHADSASHAIVTISVTNTSKVAGQAYCIDSVNDPAGDVSVNGPANPIPPHTTWTYQDDVTIADGDAPTIPQSAFSVTCSSDQFAGIS